MGDAATWLGSSRRALAVLMGSLEKILHTSAIRHDLWATAIPGGLVYVRLTRLAAGRVAVDDFASVVAEVEMAAASVVVAHNFVLAHSDKY